MPIFIEPAASPGNNADRLAPRDFHLKILVNLMDGQPNILALLSRAYCFYQFVRFHRHQPILALEMSKNKGMRRGCM